jgi:large subunit ribosomal protein L25
MENMEKVVLEKRKVVGKKNKKLLSEGYIPTVIYNSEGNSRNIKIPYSVAVKIVRHATSATVLDAEYDGKDIKVIVKEIDINPLTDKIRHIAFFEIDEKKEMTFTIPFKTVSIAPAVKNNLGILVEVLSSIDVRCKLSDLIPFIEVDISNLEHPGQSISLDELDIPKELSLENKDLAETTVVTITELQEEIVIEEPEVEELEEGEEVEGEEGEGEEGEKGEEVEGEEGAEGEGETETKEEGQEKKE